jgi:lipoate-protein ligase A
MLQQWRFINTGSNDAASNMALDEALLLVQEAGAAPPTLRVYGWSTPTLSLGYAQHSLQEANLAACQEQGVTVIRRPTGGRAVLHDQEVTYSVVLPTTLPSRPGALTEDYRRLGMALAAALRCLGLAVCLARPHRPARPQPPVASPACFTALSHYELSVAKKKIVGSAQKRLSHALLQHGSIPLWLDRQRLFACLQVPPERRAALIQEAYTTMVAVNEVAPAPVSAAALHQALRLGFASALGIEFIEAPILPEEWRLARELRQTKYATSAWNLDGAAAWRRSTADVPAGEATSDSDCPGVACNGYGTP